MWSSSRTKTTMNKLQQLAGYVMQHIPRRERAGVDLARVEVATNAHDTMREKLRISVG